MPKYPVYIPSKGRWKNGYTAKIFIKDQVDFKLVVEPQEADQYVSTFGEDRVLILPFSNLGMGSMPARNWIWDHSRSLGFERHWIYDDNIMWLYRRYKGKRILVNSNVAMDVIEAFTDRYTNIGLSGLNYEMFAPESSIMPPFNINCHVYSAMLVTNNMPYRWRLRYNEDTDLCLQILTGGMCTVLFNAFLVSKIGTMVCKGGNTDELYKGDGRLKMARTLEQMWPDYVTVKWRFKRPQHVIKDSWRCFKQPLIRRSDIDWDNLPKIDNFGMKLIMLKEIKSKELQKMYQQSQDELPVSREAE